MEALQIEITAITIAVHLVVIGVLGWLWFRSSTRQRWLGISVLGAWFALSIYLTTNGLLTDFTMLPPPMAIAMTIPIIVALILILRVSRFDHVLNRMPLYGLIGVQVYRVIGAVFFIALANGEIAVEIALVTGIMDVAVGVSALVIWLTKTTNRAVLIGWNVIGLADFAYSITLTLLAAPTAIQLLHIEGVELFGQLPLAMISVWAVPLSIILHVVVLRRLLQSAVLTKNERMISYA